MVLALLPAYQMQSTQHCHVIHRADSTSFLQLGQTEHLLIQDLTFQKTASGHWSAKLKVEVACRDCSRKVGSSSKKPWT